MDFVKDTVTMYIREMLIFRSNIRPNIVRSVVFPLVIIVFFGNIGSSVAHVPIAVVNYASNPQSSAFISGLESSHYIDVKAVTGQDAALALLKSGAVQVVVVVLPGFPAATQASPNIQVYYSNTQLSTVGVVLPFIKGLAAQFGSSAGSAQRLLLPGAVQGTVQLNPLYSSKGSYKDFLLGGLLPMVIAFGAMFGSGFSYLADRQLGNIKALLVTPMNNKSIVMGKVLSGVTQAFVYVGLALVIGLLNGANVAMGIAAVPFFALLAVLVSVSFTSLALIIASRVSKIEIFAIFAQATVLPIWFLSGGIVPTSSLPGWLYPFSVVNPVTYANDLARSVISQGFITTNNLLVDTAVMAGFAAAMLLLAFRTFRSTID